MDGFKEYYLTSKHKMELMLQRIFGKDAGKSIYSVSNTKFVFRALIFAGLVLITNGCNSPMPSNYQELERFTNAGPVSPRIDKDLIAAACWTEGQYRLVKGDVIAFEMPAILKASSAELPDWTGQSDPYRCRVDFSGNVVLPVIGAVKAEGLTLAELETAVAKAYYPRFVVTYPSIVASVSEYFTQKVSIVGAVEDSGIYDLRVDEMSMVNLLMKAGGIVDGGASAIRIKRSGDKQFSKPLMLPIEGLNVPFEDVQLNNGDVVVVQALAPQTFTVVGLVKKPGAFPFEPGVDYNVMNAIGYAGGVNEVADPRFVRIYRQDSTGEIISVVLPISGENAAESMVVKLKPGDVVSVDHTDRTNFRIMMSQILELQFGAQTIYRMDDSSR